MSSATPAHVPSAATSGGAARAKTPRTTNVACSTYVAVVVVAGVIALVKAIWGLQHGNATYAWLALALITWLSTPLALRLPDTPLVITVSESLNLIIVLGFGWEPAAITVAIDGLLNSLQQRKPRLLRTAFNVTEPVLSMLACGTAVTWLSGLEPAARMGAPLVQLILPGFIGTALYLLLNSALISTAMGLETRENVWEAWKRHVNWLKLDQLSATSVALLVVAASESASVTSVFVALPLLGALYYNYRRSIRQATEALEYAERLNRLYLGTVESLATAVDAKDQVTSGHIQRVRQLALSMLKPLGVRDEAIVKAIEAGSLLHDVGKLGVPDHILNKPGPLTPAEYEQIKRHTIIGADIVSRVEYPYPVAPIVRHHHENWDGTGYPDGLRGEDIPIGARILSVVDCYDALTSDRPYRKAMSHAAAMAIVVARRGTMYDPRVVDTFIELTGDGSGLLTLCGDAADVSPESSEERLAS